MGSTPPFRDILPTPTLLRLLKHLDEETKSRQAAEEDLRPIGRCTGVKLSVTPQRGQGLVSVLPGSQGLFQDEEEERSARRLQARGRWALREIRELTLGGGPAAGTQSPSECGSQENESRLNRLQQAEDTALGSDGMLAPETSSPQKEASFLYLGLPTMLGSSSIGLHEEQPHIQSPRAALAREEPTTSSTLVSQQIDQLRKVSKTIRSHVTFAPGPPATHGSPCEAERLLAPSFSCLRKVGASASQVSFRPSPSGLPHPPEPRPAFPRLTKPWGESKGSSPGFLVWSCLAAGGDEDAGDDGVSDMVVGSLDDRFRGPLMHTQGGGSSDIMECTQDGGLSDLMGDIEDGSSVLLEDTEDSSSSDLMGDTQDGSSSVLLADSQDSGSSDLMGDTQDGGSSDLMGDTQDGGTSDLMGDTQDGGSSELMGDTQDGGSSDLMGDTQDGGSSDFMGESQDSYSCDGLADSQDGGSMAVNQVGEGSHLLANSQDSSSDPMLSSQEGECADPLEDAQGCRKGGQSGGLVLTESYGSAGPAVFGRPLEMEETEVGPSQEMGPVAQPDMQDVYTELQRDMFYKAFLFHKFMKLGSPQQKPGHQQAKEHP